MSKAGSEVILRCLMGKESEIDIDALPWGPDDEKVPQGIETVVPALEIRPRRGLTVDEVMVNRASGKNQKMALSQVGGDECIEIKEDPG